MPVIRRADAPTFTLPDGGAVFNALAAPSRGSVENCCWELVLEADRPDGAEHSVDHEELFIVIAGRIAVTIDGERHDLGPGDCAVAPANTRLSVCNPFPEPARAIAVVPAGTKAQLGDGDPFQPPWSI